MSLFNKQYEFVKYYPSNLFELKNPLPGIVRYCIGQDPFLIRYIYRPSIGLQKIAIDTNYRSIQYIRDPTLHILEYAFKKDKDSLYYAESCSEKTLALFIKIDPTRCFWIRKAQRTQRLVNLAIIYGLCYRRIYGTFNGHVMNMLEGETLSYDIMRETVSEYPEMIEYCKKRLPVLIEIFATPLMSLYIRPNNFDIKFEYS